MDVLGFLNSIPAPVWAVVGVLAKSLLDFLARAYTTAHSPKTPQSWEEGYMKLSKEYLELRTAMHLLQAQFDGLVASVHQEPYETAARIIERAKLTK